MSKKLVFIHGRSQQGKDSAALKAEWISAFREGLAKSGLDLPIPETDIRFPYYGDTLDQLSRGMDPAQVAEVIIRGDLPSEKEKDFIKSILEEMRKKAEITDAEVDAGIPPEVVERGVLNWPWVLGILRAFDRKVPFGSAASVATFTKDVYDYITRTGVRDMIEAGVEEAIPDSEPAVVVSHSLGTVVAYNILRRAGTSSGWQIPLFVTLGCPLAVKKVRESISPTSWPPCVGAWYNAFDKRDVVALHPLSPPHFHTTPAITNKSDVDNPTENRHGIVGYLGDKEVAKTIHDALL
jgi:hypothetical protein